MKFGEVAVGEAEGAILAHSLKFGATALKKGRLLSAADIEVIAGAGVSRITVARLEPGDVAEDVAAERVARWRRSAAGVIGGGAVYGPGQSARRGERGVGPRS